MITKNKIAALLIVIFVLGAGLIIYYGRPVMKIADEPENIQAEQGESGDDVTPSAPAAEQSAPIAPAEPNQDAVKLYTLAQVEQHDTKSDCWATVNGGVYDLTTWIERHPGGPDKIIGLCGTDGSAKFNKKHGGFAPAQAALVLLKIGDLQQ